MDPKSIGLDKADTDDDDLNIDQKVAELNVEHATGCESESNRNHIECQLISVDDLSKDDGSNKIATYPNNLLTSEQDALDDVSEMEFDIAEK